MVHDNNATRIRRELLVRLAMLHFEGRLLERVDRLPVEMRPRNFHGHRLRCCVHTERAVLRYRIMAMLGFPIEDETDELKPLAEYAEEALARPRRDPRLLGVVEEACGACMKSHTFVTNACRGCMAQPCMLNCPRKAITMVDGHSSIDPDKCVNCGKCMKMCPFHAIVQAPVPCEEACPVQAIARGESGKQTIDPARCIQCGRCLQACPFGAVVEHSEYLPVLQALEGRTPTVALFAPALAGQFEASLGQVASALKALGFTEVMEVAEGADRTAQEEARELQERLEAGEPFMTTSCCPAYTALARKHLPLLAPRVSTTPTPLHFAAEEAARRYPGAKRIFIGPCLAKRREALEDPLVDHVLTFEELGAALVAKGVDVPECQALALPSQATPHGRRFAVGGGVKEAVAKHLGADRQVRSETLSGLDRENLRILRQYATGRGGAPFLEVMACEGGCVNGPCVLTNPKIARKKLETEADAPFPALSTKE